MVVIENVSVDKTKFPDRESSKRAEDIIDDAFDGTRTFLSLDRLIAGLAISERAERDNEGGDYNMAPPKVYAAIEPTLLVLIDGEPKLESLDNSTIQKIINTAFMILFDPGQSTYYLFTGQQWFSSKDIENNWQTIPNVPQNIRNVITKPSGERDAAPPSYSKIVVSTVPASLIQLDGEMVLSPIKGTDLLYVRNTESDVFVQIGTQDTFLLLSGRWFKTEKRESLADWESVDPDDLPKSFSKIPEDSPKASVLGSVPGTIQADEALIQAQIPQTAKVDRKNTTLDVTYGGDPEFQEIEGTELDYAVNTDVPVIKYKNTYYAVNDGVWFMAPTENGPWSVATSVPDEIYDIPPTNPLYRVTYVYVYDSSPDYVYVGYWPGYRGTYYYHGTIIYGTGWYYPPYYWGPRYYGYPLTYGFGFHYNGVTGNWGIHFGYGAGWVGYGYGWNRYDDIDIDVGDINFNRNIDIDIENTNLYDRWDKGEIADRVDRDQIRQQFEARDGQVARDRLASVDRESVRQRLENNPQARERLSESRAGQELQNRERSDRSVDDWRSSTNATQVKYRANDVFADRDGNIHKRNNDGSWQERQPNNSWQDSQRSQNSRKNRELNRDYDARRRGTSRTNDYRRSSASRSRTMSRSGGMRGGGMRRR